MTAVRGANRSGARTGHGALARRWPDTKMLQIPIRKLARRADPICKLRDASRPGSVSAGTRLGRDASPPGGVSKLTDRETFPQIVIRQLQRGSLRIGTATAGELTDRDPS